ncbi:MAG: hypothetical protein CMA64_10805 [Euryarchaeota archaeon]|nr:hypothetical protein [Euryarchaeota archaeon]
MTKKKKVVKEVKIPKPEMELTEEETEQQQLPPASLVGVKSAGTAEIICYLQKDDEGGRYILSNPAQISYLPVEGKQGQFKIAFVPQTPSSTGTLFVPYGKLEYLFEVKPDLAKEYQDKFEHTKVTETKKKPKFTG